MLLINNYKITLKYNILLIDHDKLMTQTKLVHAFVAIAINAILRIYMYSSFEIWSWRKLIGKSIFHKS